jgi:N-acetylneuraminic acid mutarotase
MAARKSIRRLAVLALGLFAAIASAQTAPDDWAWMAGGNTIPACKTGVCGATGVYGTLTQFAADNLPGARQEAATWTDSKGNLWLFGGNGYDGSGTLGYLNDLWELNPATKQWAWMGGSNTIPSCTIIIPNTCGESGVYGSLNTAAAGNIPGARYSAATWIDGSGNLWLFGGYGYDSVGATGPLNDLWEFNTSTMKWTWMSGSNVVASVQLTKGQAGVYGTLGVPSPQNVPGGRYAASAWIDSQGNLWLFGGAGEDSQADYFVSTFTTGSVGLLDDLWKFTPSTGEWTWEGGSSDLFEGGNPGVYGTQGAAAATNQPGGRELATSWIDNNGNFWLYGGYGFNAFDYLNTMNDLWEFSPETNEWTWMGGYVGSTSPAGTDLGVYGTLGTFAADNLPQGRNSAAGWKDSSGDLWLFGGVDLQGFGETGFFNDVWEYSLPKNEWAWMGLNIAACYSCSQAGVYGTLGTQGPANVPGGRVNSASWTDANGHLWIFGGTGVDSAGSYGYLNDLWEYQPASGTPPAITPTVTVSPSPSSITTAQALTVTITVSGGGGNPTPTGTITLTSGFYTSQATALSGGSVVITVAARSLEAAADSLTAYYTPDAASASVYTSANGSATEDVAATSQNPAFVLVQPVAYAIWTTQALPVTVEVVGVGNLIPSGSVVLTAGSYTSAPAPLIGAAQFAGWANFEIPAGSLPAGPGEITATFTPDATSAESLSVSSGTANVLVNVQPANGLDWTWMGGNDILPGVDGQFGVYGTQGDASPDSWPGGRTSFSSWSDNNGNFWMFGGQGSNSINHIAWMNDLWEFNSTSGQWTWVNGNNSGDTSKLDNNAYAPASYGTLGAFAPGNVPGGRFEAQSAIDGAGHFWMYGGEGVDSANNGGSLSDLWEYDPAKNQWAWISGSNLYTGNTGPLPGVFGTLGKPAPGNMPPARQGASAWMDKNGNFWMFGGVVPWTPATSCLVIYTVNVVNDLWMFNPSTSEWAWMGGTNPSDVPTCQDQEFIAPPPGVYGTFQTFAATNIPGARQGSANWTDSQGNIWLFGGSGWDANDKPGELNDLWEFNPTTNQWAWIGGSNTVGAKNGQPGVYGTVGTPAATNVPGARSYPEYWTDGSGNFWLFGGDGIDANNNGPTDLNDLWEFNPSTKMWTWMSGSPVLAPGVPSGAWRGIYGTIGVPDPANTSGGRDGGAGFVDKSGFFWMFGGNAWDADDHVGSMNDLFKYRPAENSPDFTITTSTPVEDVTQAGDSGTFPVTVTSENGFSGQIAFSISGNMALGVQFPASVTIPAGGSQNIQVVIASASSLGAGDFPITLTGQTAGGLLHSLVLTLQVASAGLTPTVTVTPSPASITTAQTDAVTVTVSGGNGNPTPTGSATLTSGTYSSGAVALNGGAATISIPAGSLAKGTDTLTATYTPDSSSSSIYTNATGTNVVAVTAAATTPTVKVTPSPASITTAQALTVTVTVGGTPTPTGSVTLTSGSYSSGAVTLSGGSATINVPGGSLASGTDTLTASYTPDSSSSATYSSASGVSTENVTAAATTPTVTVTPSAPNITTAVGLGVAVIVSGSPSPTGSVVLTSGTYTSAAVTLSPGILSGIATIGVPAGSLPVGTDTLTVTYTPDASSASTYTTATGSNTVSVNAASSGGGTTGWIWMNGSDMANQPSTFGTLGTAAIGDTPGGRHAASSWIDGNGNFWLLGGAGTLGGDDAGVPGYLDDFWQFNPAANLWTWMGGSTNTSLNAQAGVYGTQGVPAPGNFPGSRSGAATWTDSKGNLWLFGGDAFDINGTLSGLNDLWEFNISTNEWTWIAGSDVFVGNGPNGVYGTLGVPAPGNIPGGRISAMTWTDSKGNFWLFGGIGADSTFEDGAFGYLHDLWEFNPSTLEWTWMSGSTTSATQPAVYGTLGTPSAANLPGGRALGSTWVDSSGNLWLFGGQGAFSLAPGLAYGPVGDFNDLWEFTPSTMEWTWMGGTNPVNSQCNASSCVGQPGTYGTLGTPAPANIPGGRHGASAWTDSSGNFWLFGGAGYDGGVTSSNFNDVWEFSPSTNEWTWTGGSNTAGNGTGQPGMYGVKGAPNPTNIPGGRSEASSWVDKGGHFWLFGGSGADCTTNGGGDLNDLWEYLSGVSTSQGTGNSAGMITPTVVVSPSTSTIANTQALTVTVTVSAGSCSSSATPTGSVTLTSGTYSSGAVTLSAGSATINIPAGSLAKGTDTLTATYTPDAASSATYSSATGSNTVTVTSAATAPTVTVTPSPASITTAQGTTVTVTVSGTPTPTGSVTLTSGTYSSGAVTLSSGSATINIPGGSLAKGTDTLTANYTPDAASSATYTSATGSNTVAVTSPALITPTVTVTPSPSSVTTAQALSVTVALSGGNGNPTPTGSVTLTSGAYNSGAVTLSSGSATINIPAGSLAVNTDTLTVTYTPDSSSSTTYNSATGSNTVTVTAATVQVTIGTSPAGLSFSVDGTSYSATQTLTWTVGASHTLATTTPQTLAGTQDSFSAWSDGGALSHSVTASSTTTTYTATFTATAYQLTTAASPSADGIVTPATGTFYAPGTVVNLTATANAGFSFTNWTGSVASANSASTTVTMNAPESVTAIFGAAANSTPVAGLSSVSPLTFTATVGTTSAAQSATLTNSGNATLNITGITITGTNPTDFAIATGESACGTTLAPGANCFIYVTFTPASATTFSATLSVADNAAGSPQTASLTGTGTPLPTFTLSSPTAPQTIQPGGTAQFTITATAQNGTFSNAVALMASGLPAGAIATFTPASVTPGSSSANSTLSIQTGAANTAAVTRHNSSHNSTWPFATSALALIGLCLVPGRRHRRWITMALLLIASLGAFTGLTACGGGFGLTAAPQSYTITVTGTSGTEVQTTTVQLTVE